MTARLTKAKIAFTLATTAREIARQATASKRIQKAMRLTVLSFEQVAVEVPFYWAVYYHDGRGAVRARPGHKIVYFRDPDDDPRIDGASRTYPVRATDIRRLSKKQFFRFLKEGKLVAVDKVGPAGPHPFFTEGLKNMKNKTGTKPGFLFSEHVIDELTKSGQLFKSLAGRIRIVSI